MLFPALHRRRVQRQVSPERCRGGQLVSMSSPADVGVPVRVGLERDERGEVPARVAQAQWRARAELRLPQQRQVDTCNNTHALRKTLSFCHHSLNFSYSVIHLTYLTLVHTDA